MSDNNGNSVFLQRSFHPERLRRETELQGVSLWLSVWGGSWRDRCRRDPGRMERHPADRLLPPLLLGSALGRLGDAEQVSWCPVPQFPHL